MVRLTLMLALLAGPAASACFGPRFPEKLIDDRGHSIAILSHTGQDVTFRTAALDGALTVTALRQGIFPIAASAAGATFAYDWQTDLPPLATLEPGQSLQFQADLVVEHASRSFVELDIQVLRADHLSIAGCDYPVLVVARRLKEAGRLSVDEVSWLSLDLRLPLRVESLPAGPISTVMALE
ncbi:hypothetical protein GC209_03550 [bacterium]|nr:hypothetical protein [bacterium]